MKRAYTLVELLVVLAMIGIISSIAVINVSKLNMVTEEKEAKAFASDLKYTQWSKHLPWHRKRHFNQATCSFDRGKRR